MTEQRSKNAIVKITDVIPSQNGSSNQMFFSKTIELVVPDRLRQVILTQDKDGRIPINVNDFARITVTGPSGRTYEAEINHNDWFGNPVGEQFILSNLVPFEGGKSVIRVELWNKLDSFGSYPIYVVVTGEPQQDYRIKITDAIPGRHGNRGVFFSRTVDFYVPNNYSRIVVTSDPQGSRPWGADDWANFTITGPSGRRQKCTLGKNDAWGKPIGEQHTLSNIITMEPGENTITVELWNEFAPPGNNLGSSSMWIVVQE